MAAPVDPVLSGWVVCASHWVSSESPLARLACRGSSSLSRESLGFLTAPFWSPLLLPLPLEMYGRSGRPTENLEQK